MPHGVCNPGGYTDFRLRLFAIPGSTPVATTAPAESGLMAPDGVANRLFVFAGFASVDVRPMADDVIRRGLLEIVLDLPLSDVVILVDSAGYAGLSAYANTDQGISATFAIDCVDIVAAPTDGTVAVRPILRALVAVEGAFGNTRITGVSYVAHLQVFVAFDLKVSASHPLVPPFFGKTATVTSGKPWLLAIVLDQPAPAGGLTFALTSLNPSVTVPGSITVNAGERSATLALGDASFTAPAEIDVPIVATLPGISATVITSTAVLKLLAHP